MKWAGLYIYVAWLMWQAAGQIAVWDTNLSLWAHAAEMAPYKPRVALNYGVSLMADGQTQAGIRQFQRAGQLARLPHIPIWDRRQTDAAVAANKAAWLRRPE